MEQNNLIKTWCKSCQNFIIHKWIENDLFCNVCNIQFTNYLFSEIPNDKLLEQRERYKRQQAQKQSELLQKYLRPIKNPLEYLGFEHSDFVQSSRIIECDAGQKQINEYRKKERQEIKEKYNELKNEYEMNYSKLNRNDKCSCGSGMKYKKCHYLYFQKLQII